MVAVAVQSGYYGGGRSMAWKARLFLGLMLTVMLIAIAGPVMADDNNNRQERREDRREWREERREHDNFYVFDHDKDFDDCCHDDFKFDDEDIDDLDFDF